MIANEIDTFCPTVSPFLSFSSRPTAVNLAEAMARMTSALDAAAAETGASASSVVNALIAAADAYLAADVAANVALGDAGADAVLAAASSPTVSVLTHCNAGALATAGHGTAVGVIRSLAARGALAHAWCTETRPYNQGARLTAYELAAEGLPATLIVDSAAAGLLIHGGEGDGWRGKPSAVVVGADRVAANGDTANKVGTLALAVAAARGGVPFFVAAPTTTLDAGVADGAGIPIEQRPAEEVTHAAGGAGPRVAAAGVGVWNPSFDVTPADLITGGIITEKGMVGRRGDGAYDVAAFVAAPVAPGGAAAAPPPSAAPLTADDARAYVAARPDLAARVGPPASAREWAVVERSDGNLNWVFSVAGPAGALILKQALPYIRIDADWPLSVDRAAVEAAALAEHGRLAPGAVPGLYAFDAARAILAMEFVPPPAAVVRPLLADGAILPRLAADVGAYAAATLFGSSPLAARDSAAWRALAARFDNPALNALTEKVVFTDPFHAAPTNAHTAPFLDGMVESLRADAAAVAAATALKLKFATARQALLHGDLHTGSVMAAPDGSGRAVVIDPEFATMGPVGYDVGKFAANLLLAFFAADGRRGDAARPRSDDASVDAQQAWLAGAVPEFWGAFEAAFRGAWSAAAAAGTGDETSATAASLFGPDAPAPAASLAATQDAVLAGVYDDAVRYGGVVLLRRVVGIAHVAEMKAVADPATRATVEARALRLGRAMLVGGAAAFADYGAVVAAAAAERGVDGFEWGAAAA